MMPKDDGPVLVQPLALPVLRAKIPERGPLLALETYYGSTKEGEKGRVWNPIRVDVARAINCTIGVA